MRPERLRPDNFTPPTRTPWGGRKILTRLKRDLRLDADVIGESWEVSVEPSFPSRVEGTGQTLRDLIAADPVGWLGDSVAARYGQSPLLVKLLDAADNLSVQVHPAPDDPALASDESGKPESWIVLDAEPGAGIYLGLREGVERRHVERCLDEGGALDELLNFVPAIPGEAWIIEAGTIHAIGGGVTVIEPQHVAPGRRGLTYRFWDWNRRYDAEGHLDPGGVPRPLHVERSLAVTRWGGPRGDAFVESCRSRPVAIQAASRLSDPISAIRGAGASAATIGAATGGADASGAAAIGAARVRVVRTDWFEAERWSGDGPLRVLADTMIALTCVAGAVRVDTPLGALDLTCGHSGVVPAAAGHLDIRLHAAEVFAAWSR